MKIGVGPHYSPSNYPTIAIVTPCLNQGQFLEEAIISVHASGYPNLEHVIIDGGSTDKSVDIIRKYEHQLIYWESTPDKGQYDAINKGFAKTSGEIMGWLNSDDKYTPWALPVVADVFSTFPHVDWITTSYPLTCNDRGLVVDCRFGSGFDARSFFRGANVPGMNRYGRVIQQESTFWRRTLWEQAGGYVDIEFKFAGDFALWARFFRYADLYSVNVPLGEFRRHSSQKTATCLHEYQKEAKTVLCLAHGKPYGKLEQSIRRYLMYVFGRRSLRKISAPAGALLTRMSILNRCNTCVWNDGSWKIEVDYCV
jgi:glycosyltransferase involved in cell wall biosynthesis